MLSSFCLSSVGSQYNQRLEREKWLTDGCKTFFSSCVIKTMKHKVLKKEAWLQTEEELSIK